MEAGFRPKFYLMTKRWRTTRITRGAFSLQSSGRPAPGWTFDTDINYVSDNDYLGDLGESLAVTSGRHLERLGQVRYTGSDWSLLGRAQYFQTIDDTIASSDRPYRRLPRFYSN